MMGISGDGRHGSCRPRRLHVTREAQVRKAFPGGAWLCASLCERYGFDTAEAFIMVQVSGLGARRIADGRC